MKGFDSVNGFSLSYRNKSLACVKRLCKAYLDNYNDITIVITKRSGVYQASIDGFCNGGD